MITALAIIGAAAVAAGVIGGIRWLDHPGWGRACPPGKCSAAARRALDSIRSKQLR